MSYARDKSGWEFVRNHPPPSDPNFYAVIRELAGSKTWEETHRAKEKLLHLWGYTPPPKPYPLVPIDPSIEQDRLRHEYRTRLVTMEEKYKPSTKKTKRRDRELEHEFDF